MLSLWLSFERSSWTACASHTWWRFHVSSTHLTYHRQIPFNWCWTAHHTRLYFSTAWNSALFCSVVPVTPLHAPLFCSTSKTSTPPENLPDSSIDSRLHDRPVIQWKSVATFWVGETNSCPQIFEYKNVACIALFIIRKIFIDYKISSRDVI